MSSSATGKSATVLKRETGADNVGYKSKLALAVSRTLADKMAEIVTLYDFGAVGDGIIDDTIAVKNAFASGVDITVTMGNYLIDPVDSNHPTTKYGGGVKPSDNTTIRFVGGALFTAKTNSFGEYVVINLDGTTNVKIIDGWVVGDVATHTGGTGEFGFGFYLGSSVDPKLIRCKSDKCWGDGFYIGAGELTPTVEPIRPLLADCDADDNRRQGLSIVNCVRGLVYGGTYRNTGLTASTSPAFGIDIEPDPSGQMQVDVEIINVETSGNFGGGLQLVPGFMSNPDYTSRNYRVRVANFTSYQDGSKGGLRCAFPSLTDSNINLSNTIHGEIEINGARIVESVSRGVDFARWIPTAPYVKMTDVSVIDCNTSGGTVTTAEQCGFVVQALTGDLTQQTSTGKIDLIRPSVIDTRAVPKTLLPIYLNGQSAGQTIDNINIIDPRGENWLSTSNGLVNISATNAARIKFTTLKPIKTFTGSAALVSGQFSGYEVSASSSAVITLPLANDSIGLQYIFNNRFGVTLQIKPNAADTIATLGLTAGNDAVMRDAGDYLIVESIGSNRWIVREYSGNIHPLGYGSGALPNHAYLQGVGSPVGVVTPLKVKTPYLDTTNKTWYIATGLNNADWV